MQLRPHDGYDSTITGTSNWDDVKDSDVFIITAGIPRKPGMNRDEFIKKLEMKIYDEIKKIS